MGKKIFSFDAETNGLWGKAFAIAAVVTDENGKEIDQFIGRCPVQGEVNHWVSENVIPEMEDIPVTHGSYEDLLDSFIKFWMSHKENAVALVHMGHIVEAKLFRDAHDLELLWDWDAPYLWYDLCIIPEIGESVDNYIKSNGISLPELEGGTHNPLYDSYAALYAYLHIMNKN